MIMHGRGMRILINDVDISGLVRDVTIRHAVDSVSEVEMTLLCAPESGSDADGYALQIYTSAEARQRIKEKSTIDTTGRQIKIR